MSVPVLSTPTVVGSATRDGRNYVNIDTPTTIRLTCVSSGTQAKSVQLRISWGDDTETVAEGLVGLEEGVSHTYADFGIYTISVVAVNEMREESALRSVPVWVERVTERQKKLVRWRGLALPTADSRSSIAVRANEYQTIDFGLAANAFTDQTEITVTGRTAGYLGAEFVLSQTGRLYTSGRIVGAQNNQFVLDTALADNYTAAARLEVTQRSYSGTTVAVPDRSSPWFFPISTDEDLIRSSLTVCFSCRKMEMLHLPEFGSELPRMPFEPGDLITAGLIEIELRDAAAWEPRARLDDISVVLDGNTISVSSSIRYNGDSKSAIFNASIPLGLT